jgi:hypothetical protein
MYTRIQKRSKGGHGMAAIKQSFVTAQPLKKRCISLCIQIVLLMHWILSEKKIMFSGLGAFDNIK